MENLWIVAQTAEAQGQSEVQAEPVGQNQGTTGTMTAADPNTSRTTAPMNSQSSNYLQLLFIGGIFVIMYFILFREHRKRQRQQQQMVQSIKKKDKVRTIGGIIGTVVEVKDDEIVLKVDESNNTKIRIMASAIGKNLSNEEK